MINNTKDLWNNHRKTYKCKSSYVYIDTHKHTHTVNVELYYNGKDNGPICAPFMRHVPLYRDEYQIMVHKTLSNRHNNFTIHIIQVRNDDLNSFLNFHFPFSAPRATFPLGWTHHVCSISWTGEWRDGTDSIHWLIFLDFHPSLFVVRSGFVNYSNAVACAWV